MFPYPQNFCKYCSMDFLLYLFLQDKDIRIIFGYFYEDKAINALCQVKYPVEGHFLCIFLLHAPNFLSIRIGVAIFTTPSFAYLPHSISSCHVLPPSLTPSFTYLPHSISSCHVLPPSLTPSFTYLPHSISSCHVLPPSLTPSFTYLPHSISSCHVLPPSLTSFSTLFTYLHFHVTSHHHHHHLSPSHFSLQIFPLILHLACPPSHPTSLPPTSPTLPPHLSYPPTSPTLPPLLPSHHHLSYPPTTTSPTLLPHLSYFPPPPLLPSHHHLSYPPTPPLLPSYPTSPTLPPHLSYPPTPPLLPSHPTSPTLPPHLSCPPTPPLLPSHPTTLPLSSSASFLPKFL